MALDNYRDLSVSGSDVGAGFQFEFNCNNCDRRWKSSFKPYRMGQLTGLLTRFSFIFEGTRTAGKATGNFADIGSRGAKEKAFAEALAQAQTRYTECPTCRKAMCADCFDERQDSCTRCLSEARDEQGRQERSRHDQAASQTSCPNCSAAHAGGRFCAECGYDMASAFKGCPTCGAMSARNARFCGDCGHGF